MVLKSNNNKSDLHVHTSFSDGAQTPLEIIQNGIFFPFISGIGFTDHFYLRFLHPLAQPTIINHLREIHNLNTSTNNRINVFLGVEITPELFLQRIRPKSLVEVINENILLTNAQIVLFENFFDWFGFKKACKLAKAFQSPQKIVSLAHLLPSTVITHKTERKVFIETLLDYQIALELNCFYETFLKEPEMFLTLGDAGGTFTIGSDAHFAGSAGKIEKAWNWLKKHSFEKQVAQPETPFYLTAEK
ncbi:MAG: hypothetical protein ACFFCQ_07960 [Promethearchaeota archaeon]